MESLMPKKHILKKEDCHYKFCHQGLKRMSSAVKGNRSVKPASEDLIMHLTVNDWVILRNTLQDFMKRYYDDSRITSVHISIYMALLLAYLLHASENPIQIDHEVLMRHAKMNARATYYKSLQDLHEFGYIDYIPSHNVFLGSLVYLKRI